MRLTACLACLVLLTPSSICLGQGSVPTFKYSRGSALYTLVGGDPARGQTTKIPTVLVPLTLVFAEQRPRQGTVALDAKADVTKVLRSPLFARFAFPHGGETQYADALLRTTFSSATTWHTLLATPTIAPLTIAVPAGSGYLLRSRESGGLLAVVDVDYVQKQLFSRLPKYAGSLVIAITHNATFYVAGDATICCSAGTHGIDATTGTSFVLASYLNDVPAIVRDRDIQPLTQQLAEFIYDPLHNPQSYGYNVTAPGSTVPAWSRDEEGEGCGGTGIASSYFLLQPTDSNKKNNLPSSPAFIAQVGNYTYHLENVALLPWYLGADASTGSTLSFPDPRALKTAASACLGRTDEGMRSAQRSSPPAYTKAPLTPTNNHHQLIGYWTGHGANGASFPLRDVPPQWDIIIVAFAAPATGEPEGTLRFRLPQGISSDQFKADLSSLRRDGRKVMLSLGGGGAYFSLTQASNISNFTSSVTAIVEQYGFDGVDIDFETPSLALQEGDRDFKHPSTASTVNLIVGLRQLQAHFGAGFMLSLVPEGPQLPAGFVSYGGQFGSYLPIVYALRDSLTFVDVQDYNSPPLQGLDGEVYQSHTVSYHAAVTELLLKGFPVAGTPSQFFPPMPAHKVAVGFLTGYEDPDTADGAMTYLITGRSVDRTSYKLRSVMGYPDLLGAMFWTIDDDRLQNDRYSDRLGRSLHGLDRGP